MPDPYESACENLRGKIATSTDPFEVQELQKQLDALSKKSETFSTDQQKRKMQMVGALQYVATVSRPDISYASGVLARYMMSPTQFLMKCTDRVMRYLIQTTNYDLILKGSKGQGRPLS